MSLAAEAVSCVFVPDPKTDFAPIRYPIRGGSSTSAWLQSSATGNYPSTRFSITPPNPSGSVLSRRLLISNQFRVRFTAAVAPTAGLLNLGLTDSLSCLPFTSTIDTVSIQYNNAQFNMSNVSEVMPPLRRFNQNALFYKQANSSAPWYPDQAAIYPTDAAYLGNGPVVAGTTIGSALQTSQRNACASALLGGDIDCPRGAFNDVSIVAGGGAADTFVVLQFTTTEALVLDPFVGTIDGGLPYCQTLNISITSTDLRRVLSHGLRGLAGAVSSFITGATFETGFSPVQTLWYQSTSVNPLLPLPKVVSLRYETVSTNITAVTIPASPNGTAVVAPNTFPAGTNVTSNVITYPCIPSLIYVFVKNAVSLYNPSVPPYTYCLGGPANSAGNGLSIQWCSRSGVLTGLTNQELYAIAQSHGLSQSYQQFAGSLVMGGSTAAIPIPQSLPGQGMCLAFAPGRDWELGVGEAPGLQGSFQFQVSLNVWNQAPTADGVAPGTADASTLYVVAILPSIATFSDGFQVNQTIGMLTQGDVLTATQAAEHVSEALVKTEGSGFLGNIMSSVPNVMGHVRAGARAARAALNKASDMGILGEGAASGFFGGSAMAGGYLAGGSAMAGGRLMSSKQLASRRR